MPTVAPACVRCRWGTGTTCEKQTGAAKEMEQRLQQMMAEREKQTAAWLAPSPTAIKPPSDHTEPSSYVSETPQNKRK